MRVQLQPEGATGGGLPYDDWRLNTLLHLMPDELRALGLPSRRRYPFGPKPQTVFYLGDVASSIGQRVVGIDSSVATGSWRRQRGWRSLPEVITSIGAQVDRQETLLGMVTTLAAIKELGPEYVGQKTEVEIAAPVARGSSASQG